MLLDVKSNKGILVIKNCENKQAQPNLIVWWNSDKKLLTDILIAFNVSVSK